VNYSAPENNLDQAKKELNNHPFENQMVRVILRNLKICIFFSIFIYPVVGRFLPLELPLSTARATST